MSSDAPETPPPSPDVLDEAHLLRSVVRLAWPVVVQQVSFAMVQLVDTALVGDLGQDALAGVRLAGQIFWISLSGMTAVGVGATAVIARAVGARRTGDADKTLRTAAILALIWGIGIGVGMWFLGEWSLGMLGAEEGAKQEGATYLKASAIGMPFWSLMFAGSAALQGAGDTRLPMVIGVFVNIVNGILSYVLINGIGPAPQLDVQGAGVGYSIAAMLGAVLTFGALAMRRGALHWAPARAAEFDSGEASRILSVGVPAGLEQGQFMFAFMIYTRVIATLGTAAVAAHGVTLALQGLTFGVGFAISVATSAIVGQSLGAKRPDLAEKSTYLAMRYSVGFLVVLALVFILLGDQITGIFISGEDAAEVIDLGSDLLFIFAFAMPALGVSLSISGALRGAGDTRAVLLITAGSTWIVRLIPAYLLAITFGLGVQGAWLAAILDINFRSVLLFLRFRAGKWKQMKV
jgi:putative MATE family efflux protein